MLKKEIVDYIKHLTSNDKKTLSQKALKAAEEVGELAKCVLPFDNASGTIHRFVDRKKILEEVCDTMLTVMSIAYELDASDEEIEQMIIDKSKKWADLQAREGRLKFPIPYEIHVTVDMDGEDIEYFKEMCQRLNVKPILLDLHLQDGAVVKDMMTSSVHMGNNRSAYEEMKRISVGLECFHMNVIREKIETVPWHPAAPSFDHGNPVMPPSCYFECHFNVISHVEDLDELDHIAKRNRAKKSRNVFKKLNDDLVTTMVTYREYEGTYERFKEKIQDLKEDLEMHGFELEKEIVEFSIYDTRVSHDSAWILGESEASNERNMVNSAR